MIQPAKEQRLIIKFSCHLILELFLTNPSWFWLFTASTNLAENPLAGQALVMLILLPDCCSRKMSSLYDWFLCTAYRTRRRQSKTKFQWNKKRTVLIPYIFYLEILIEIEVYINQEPVWIYLNSLYFNKELFLLSIFLISMKSKWEYSQRKRDGVNKITPSRFSL